MQNIRGIELNDASREELLPGFSADFPYIATRAELDKYSEPFVPWHWHRTVELFYMESGTLEYTTPNGKWVFPAGTGGMVNSNVLHSSAFPNSREGSTQLLHLFDPSLLAGEHGSRMGAKYIFPLTTAPGVEIIPLSPEDPAQKAILNRILGAFELSEEEWGYEFRLREALTHIWLGLYELARPAIERGGQRDAGDVQIKLLMGYIQEHLSEPISVDQLAQIAHISRRACFRLFQDTLHMPPAAYIQSCRLQKACQLLTKTNDPVTQIAFSCGFGSSSYFGKTFHEKYGCSPLAYRNRMARL
ncbi:MAG: helix-turn-helix domain-containing protein [Eubacteriales bacterium]|nr:helix-turn-helix domain-containing protein [Eubacteriales bacterium]